jgi:uncharacterized RDD family membrane protein YckC
MPGVITPEAVRLEFQAASIGTRSLAIIIDLAIQTFVVLIATFGIGIVASVGVGPRIPEWVGVTLILLLFFGILWGYPTAFETLRGRTPGKAAMGLRVVTREGAPVTFRHAAIRAAFALLDLYGTVGGVAVLSVLLSRREQRLGDLVAGTLVLRERSAVPPPHPMRFWVPTGLEEYAQTLDPAVIDAAGYQAVRTFLQRSFALSPDVRWRVSFDIAEPIIARLGQRPPPQLTPELFLVCLAARYQQQRV